MELLVSGVRKLGLSLTPYQVDRFQLYYEELVSWNKRLNLTAIIDYQQVQTRHFLDSLTLTLVLRDTPWWQGAFSLLDIGTGAGMPGVPLKILFPEMKLVLLDSIAKKTDFLRYLAGRLELERTEILTGRAEDIAHQENYREQFDLVVSRAVGKLSTLAELALPLCKVGGAFIAPKKGQVEPEVARAERALALLGGRLREIKRVELEELGEERLLVVVDKMSPTPPSYPRRAGVPSRRPL